MNKAWFRAADLPRKRGGGKKTRGEAKEKANEKRESLRGIYFGDWNEKGNMMRP